jgi:hypothetical protein
VGSDDRGSDGADVYALAEKAEAVQEKDSGALDLLMAELSAVRALVEEQLAPAVGELQKLKEEVGLVRGEGQVAPVEQELVAVGASPEMAVAEESQPVASVEAVVTEVVREGAVEGVGVPGGAVIEPTAVVVAAVEKRVDEVQTLVTAVETVVNEGLVSSPPPSPEVTGAGAREEGDASVAPTSASNEIKKPTESPAVAVVVETATPASVVVAPAPVVEAPAVEEPIGPVAQVRPVVDCEVMTGVTKKGLLSRIRLGASLGIYLSEDKLVWSLAEKVPMGVRIAETFEQPITRTEWAAGVAKILDKYLVGRAKKSMKVVIGLPASHVFFATLPQSAKGEKAETLLTNHNCCSAIPATELCCGLVPLKVMGKTFASVGAARRKEIATLTDVGRNAGSSMVRVEAAPWALLRLGAKGKAGTKAVMRLYVSGTEMVAVLAQGAHALLWRTIELSTSGAEAADSILSLVRTFETYAQQHVGLEEISSITLQGEEMPERLPERLQAELGAKFSPIEGPGPTASAISKGLALGGLEWEKPALDLASSLAPPPRLADLVPYGELALMAALVVCSGLWLWSAGNEAQDRAQRVEDSNAKNVVLKTEDSRLMQEKTVLGAEVLSVTKFLSNRVLWTEYVNQIAARVPENVNCLQMQGDYEMSTGTEKNEKKLKRSFQVDFTANLAKDVSAPPEVDQVLASLRQSPVIRRDFPEMRMASLRVNKAQKRGAVDGTDPATFTVSCMPKAKPAAAAPPPDKSEGGAAKH